MKGRIFLPLVVAGLLTACGIIDNPFEKDDDDNNESVQDQLLNGIGNSLSLNFELSSDQVGLMTSGAKKDLNNGTSLRLAGSITDPNDIKQVLPEVVKELVKEPDDAGIAEAMRYKVAVKIPEYALELISGKANGLSLEEQKELAAKPIAAAFESLAQAGIPAADLATAASDMANGILVLNKTGYFKADDLKDILGMAAENSMLALKVAGLDVSTYGGPFIAKLVDNANDALTNIQSDASAVTYVPDIAGSLLQRAVGKLDDALGNADKAVDAVKSFYAKAVGSLANAGIPSEKFSEVSSKMYEYGMKGVAEFKASGFDGASVQANAVSAMLEGSVMAAKTLKVSDVGGFSSALNKIGLEKCAQYIPTFKDQAAMNTLSGKMADDLADAYGSLKTDGYISATQVSDYTKVATNAAMEALKTVSANFSFDMNAMMTGFSQNMATVPGMTISELEKIASNINGAISGSGYFTAAQIGSMTGVVNQAFDPAQMQASCAAPNVWNSTTNVCQPPDQTSSTTSGGTTTTTPTSSTSTNATTCAAKGGTDYQTYCKIYIGNFDCAGNGLGAAQPTTEPGITYCF